MIYDQVAHANGLSLQDLFALGELEVLRLCLAFEVAEKAEEPILMARGMAACTATDDEFFDDGEPHYHPAEKWAGVHDFDGGSCWRCDGTEAGTTRRPHTFTISAELAADLLAAHDAVGR